MYYKNDINDKNAKIEYNNKDKNAWKLANKKVELELSLPNYKSKISGKIDISLFDLIKTNMGLYAMTTIGIVLVLEVIVYSTRFINIRNTRSKRYKSRYRRR